VSKAGKKERPSTLPLKKEEERQLFRRCEGKGAISLSFFDTDPSFLLMNGGAVALLSSKYRGDGTGALHAS